MYIYFFIYKYFYCCYRIYICAKTLSSFMLSLQKNDSFFSFHSPIFHSKIHKHPAFKMNRDEQERSRSKIRSLE